MSNSRRKLLQNSLALSLVGSFLPTNWTKPVINTVILPVHAMTSDETPDETPDEGCSSGFIEEPVSEAILITITGSEVSGPIVATLGNSTFAGSETLSLGMCANNVDELTETIEFSGSLDSSTNTITGDIVIRQFCSGALACEQITSYTVTQTVISDEDDGEYQGMLIGTLTCCQDFF